MALSNETLQFYKKLSRIWQNSVNYNFFKEIQLSPDQIKIIEEEQDQMFIDGFAGTGKSITLIYKFINTLIKEQDRKRILYVTFNRTLIEDTRKRLNRAVEFCDNRGKHDVKISTFHEMSYDLLRDLKIIDQGIKKINLKDIEIYKGNTLRRVAGILSKYVEENNKEFVHLPKDEKLFKSHSQAFITEEILWMKANGLINLKDYLETPRTGRSQSVRLTQKQRNTVYKIFEEYENQLKSKFHDHLDLEDYALRIIKNIDIIEDKYKFDYIFVDEVQDLDPMQLKALCLLTKESIVLAGDAKQKIYKKSPLTYEKIGIRIREKGKHKVLNKNYRSTAQIVKLANSLKFSDVEEKLIEKHFVREGDKPTIAFFNDLKNSLNYVVNEINKLYSRNDKITIAIINREEVKEKTGKYKSNTRIYLEQRLLTGFSDIENYNKRFDHEGRKQIFYTNPYDVKGLEFDAVFVLDFTRRYYPNIKDIKDVRSENEGKEKVLEENDIEDIVNREKRLLYVAMTRAREKLYLVSYGDNLKTYISPFILDFDPSEYEAQNFTKVEIERLRAIFRGGYVI